jgi:hypothetical protein
MKRLTVSISGGRLFVLTLTKLTRDPLPFPVSLLIAFALTLDSCQFLSSPLFDVFPVSPCIGWQNKVGKVVGMGRSKLI